VFQLEEVDLVVFLPLLVFQVVVLEVFHDVVQEVVVLELVFQDERVVLVVEVFVDAFFATAVFHVVFLLVFVVVLVCHSCLYPTPIPLIIIQNYLCN
jgi:hypothetical protein